MKISFKSHVVYFFAPSFKESSAGIKTLYQIVDLFNNEGLDSHIVLQNETIGSPRSTLKYHFNAPLLTLDALEKHREEQRIPVLVYPDTVYTNPFHAENVCRIILYFDGALSGHSSLYNSKKEGIIFFSRSIMHESNIKNALYQQILSLPLLDINYPIRNNKKNRKEIYYYDGKFTSNFDGMIPDDIKQYTSISRDKKNSLNRNEIFSLLKDAKLIHIFEDTALIYESLLLGCPVNIHPNGKFYKCKPLGDNEVKLYGSMTKRYVSEKDIEKAMNEIDLFRDEYERWKTKGIDDVKKVLEKIKIHKYSFSNNLYKKLKNNILETNKFIDEDNETAKHGSRLSKKIIIFIIRQAYKLYLILIKFRIIRLISRKLVIFIYSKLSTKLKRVVHSSLK
tara:strand:- start:15026 stop:16207 length:1182 start_codon:yes stop_codon:yes gene_type:complete